MRDLPKRELFAGLREVTLMLPALSKPRAVLWCFAIRPPIRYLTLLVRVSRANFASSRLSQVMRRLPNRYYIATMGMYLAPRFL